MTYSGSEVSVHGGKPVELYKFEGTYENFYYTSGPRAVKYDGNTYAPIAISRSEINAGTQEDDGLDLTIELSVRHRVVQVYGFQNSPPKLDFTLYRFHSLDDVVPYWQGVIDNISVAEEGVATIRSPSLLGAALAAQIPNVYYQSPCNNVLFDRRCKVLEADWTGAGIVGTVAGRVINLVAAPAAKFDGKLIGGELRVASGERRMITAQNGKEIIVNFPFSKLAPAQAVSFTAGCDLAYLGDCATKFANQRNFGGFPFIPTANPFTDGIDPDAVILPDNTCKVRQFEGWYWRIGYKISRTGPNFANDAIGAGAKSFGGDWQMIFSDGFNNHWEYECHREAYEQANGVKLATGTPAQVRIDYYAFAYEGNRCYERFVDPPVNPSAFCTGRLSVQHWTMENPVVVWTGAHSDQANVPINFLLP